MTSELLKPYLAWLHLHPHWAGFAAFLIAFFESLAVVGLLVPGTVVMTAIGVLIGTAVLPFIDITLWSIVGAIAGDVLSFWLGYRYHQQVRERWPFRHYPKLLEKGELFFRQHGGKGVFLGRFIGPMRPIVPLIAGMLSMRPARFILVDCISGILWAPAYMLPGILIGAASQELPPEMATRLLFFSVVALLIFWCVSWLLKQIYFSIMSKVHRLLAFWWSWVRQHPRLYRLDHFLQDPRYPENHAQFGLSLLLLLLVGLFLCLAHSVIQHGPLTEWNAPVYHLMRGLRATILDQIMVLITFVGEAPVLLFMWLAITLWLLLKRYWRAAIHWFLAGFLWVVAVEGVKHFVHFPRPTGLFRSPKGWSFPSGHAAGSCLFFGYLAVLLSYNRARIGRWVALLTVSVLVIAIIFSRLYLGAHWLTDVIGGTLLGLIITCGLTISYRRRATIALAPTGVIFVAIFSLALAWGGYFQKNYIEALHDYTPYWPKYTINMQQWWNHAAKQIPLYRYNRFGKPIQVINLQWAGSSNNIEQNLTDRGWHKESRGSLVILLSGLLAKNNGKHLPVLSQLYEDRRPVLVMTKYLDQQNTILILRLWDAHLKTEAGLPLWLGTIGYHHWSKLYFLRREREQSINEDVDLMPATQLLIKDLAKFTWQQVYYKQIPRAITQADASWNGYVLFVQP